MLRTALASVARTPARSTHVTRQVFRHSYPVFVRYQSTTPDREALKAARKANDELQRDWRSPILTYEQVKPKTLHPSSVCFILGSFAFFDLTEFLLGCVSYRRA